jgi:ABC-type antimicrobial peptide transport system permease subunit
MTIKRAIILGLVPPAAAIVVCAIIAAVGIGLTWGFLSLRQPGDPSVFDTVAWMLILTTPIWIVLFPMLGLIAGVIACFIARRRFDKNSRRTTAKTN